MSDIKEIKALTSLRIFAALGVLVYHSGSSALYNSGIAPRFVTNILQNGYLGVSFFFVLSGFILTLVYQGRLNNRVDLQKFGLARLARVYPVYLLALLLLLPYAMLQPITVSALPQFFLLQSWLPLACVKTSWEIPNWNMQAWTLSIEFFFYLLFPFLINFLGARSHRVVAAVTLLTAMTILALRLSAPPETPSLNAAPLAYLPLPLLRTPEFIYGIGLGLLHTRGLIARSPLALFLVVVCLIGCMAISNEDWVAPIITVLAGGIIALIPGSLSTGPIARVLNSNTLVLWGGASYAVYLLQFPVRLMISSAFRGPLTDIGRVAYFPILLLAALLVFKFWESPMRKLILRRKPLEAIPAVTAAR